ncbi:MAG: hypothetical protein FWD05_09565 [Oscillospiraceae bacterium]|nr:hypothetical protein [Oscillospiraceae bacterium]
MPRIQSSIDLRNNNEISDEMLNGKLELYRLLDEGRAAAKAGHKRPYEDVFDDLEQAE